VAVTGWGSFGFIPRKGQEVAAMPGSNGVLQDWTFDALAWSARTLGGIGPLRRSLADRAERRLREKGSRPVPRHTLAVEQDKAAFSLALLHMAERALAERRVGRPAVRSLLKTVLSDILMHRGDDNESAKERFRTRHQGMTPPGFLTISPGKACNLACVGCYANSGTHGEKLEWATVDRIVREAHDEWGNRFFVLSGGEPLAWRESRKGVLELAEAHPDCFFIMYSNGTLIDDAVARRMGRLGNLSPALSIEGMKARTDARRGEGVFDRIVAAAERLGREGVLFGMSLTATRENSDEILRDEVLETFVDRLGALYAFVFHYMPIGRAVTLDLMMTAEQRLRLYQRTWSLIRDRHLFVVDFWNGATGSNGCLAAGRPGGYFHINWNGDVSPCVFFPYSPVNVQAVYSRGGSLDDAWAHPFFASIRRWQREYGYRESHETCSSCRNWIAPCIIRDHHSEFRRIMAAHDARPTDEDAKAALEDPGWHDGLEQFDREFSALTDPLWQAQYTNGSKGTPPGPMKRL
jgi:radical SAM protein with 4Fe4S-binding SPASM domain